MEFSNNYAETADALADTKFSLQSDEEKITALDGRVAGLEGAEPGAGQNAAALSNQLASANDAQQKLADAETNNTFLTAEFQKQMEQKNEMEHKFNDLDALRTQIKKLRDEKFVARRLQWMSNGTDPTRSKGGQLLMHHAAFHRAEPTAPSQYDLNVEVGSDGSIHVILPPRPTNSPAH